MPLESYIVWLDDAYQEFPTSLESTQMYSSLKKVSWKQVHLTSWNFAKVFLCPRKFLGAPRHLCFDWPKTIFQDSLCIFMLRKKVEPRSSVTHSHAWKMCATLKNCISSFLTELRAPKMHPFSQSQSQWHFMPLCQCQNDSLFQHWLLALCCTLVHEAHFFQDLCY